MLFFTALLLYFLTVFVLSAVEGAASTFDCLEKPFKAQRRAIICSTHHNIPRKINLEIIGWFITPNPFWGPSRTGKRTARVSFGNFRRPGLIWGPMLLIRWKNMCCVADILIFRTDKFNSMMMFFSLFGIPHFVFHFLWIKLHFWCTSLQ